VNILFVIAGLVVLQIFLSRRQSKLLGLILPAISLIISIVIVLGMVGFSAHKTITANEIISENGEIIEQIETAKDNADDITTIILPAIYLFLLSNIPTIILIGIYFACRKKLKRAREIEKMNIQDLE